MFKLTVIVGKKEQLGLDRGQWRIQGGSLVRTNPMPSGRIRVWWLKTLELHGVTKRHFTEAVDSLILHQQEYIEG